MIDVHCHLEQKDYEKDRDSVIENCKTAGLKAIVTSCANPKDLELTLEIAENHKGFVFACAGLHPEYIKEIRQKEVDEYLEAIRKNRGRIVAIGEVGLDFFWVKEKEWQQKQGEQFAELIRFSKDLKKPLVIHSRDGEEKACQSTLDILEKEDAKNVDLHMFGANDLVGRIIGNGWNVSINTIVERSKKHKKVTRDMPIEKIMLETDAPWLGFGKRNEPASIRHVAEEIAEIKKLDFEVVWKTCGNNAVKFFNLET